MRDEEEKLVVDQPIQFSKYFFQSYYPAQLRIYEHCSLYKMKVFSLSHGQETIHFEQDQIEFFTLVETNKKREYKLKLAPKKHKFYIQFETDKIHVEFKNQMDTIMKKEYLAKSKFGISASVESTSTPEITATGFIF